MIDKPNQKEVWTMTKTTLGPASTASSTSSTTAWDKRLAEPKGFVEYNPTETFVIHVQWVVGNRQIAEEMLQALNVCARATLRDAPPVPCYFFRISHNQQLAIELKNKVKTIGDHPQFAKKFKMMDMNMPLSVIAATCDREGISSIPFREGQDNGSDGIWTKDTPMTHERATLLGFDPIVLDCTEIYLDNRSFSNHACSKDYLSAYSILMQPFRSLQVHTIVAGTPTIGIWNRVLEPMLKARRAAEPERLTLQPNVWSDFGAATTLSSSLSHYLLLDVNVTNVQVAEDLIASVPNSPYHCLFQLPDLSSSSTTTGAVVGYRLIMPVAVADADKIREVLVARQEVQKDDEQGAAVSGRIMLFAKEESTEASSSDNNNQQMITMLQEMFTSNKHPGIEIVLVDTTSLSTSQGGDHDELSSNNNDSTNLFAGYGLTDKLAELVADTTVECKDYDKE